MAQEYPLIFEADPDRAELSGVQGEQSSITAPVPWPWPWSRGPEVSTELVPDAGQECHRFRLAEIRNWVEVKTTWELKCTKIFGKKICTKVPVIYHRTCTKFAYVDVCYPAGVVSDVSACVTSAALASAVAAIISSGSAAAGTFKVALEACLLAKGAKWADKVSVNAGWDSDCGPWH